MKTQQDKIEEALNSINGIQRASMPKGLQERIMLRMGQAKIIAIPRRTIWMMAAGIALLAGLNYYTVVSAGSKTNTEMTADNRNPIAAEYFTPTPTI